MVDLSGRSRAANMGGADAQWWALLNEAVSILGTTKPALWPCFEATGSAVVGFAPSDLTPRDETAARALESEFTPRVLRSGVQYVYRGTVAGNNHLTAGDHANYSFGNGTVDGAFSVGGWFCPADIATVALLAKYDAAGTLREWAFRINSDGKLALELFDESADASEVGVGEDVLTANVMQFLVATYDGGETAPVVKFYVDGVHDGGDGATAETGSYVAMEDLATELLVGASEVPTGPLELFDGWRTLPFVTGKALTADEVSALYAVTRQLVGA